MSSVEVSRTLVKSPPELWTELEQGRLSQAVGAVAVEPAEPERSLAWVADGLRGTARLEPSGWGTKVTLTAEVEDTQAPRGLWSPFRGWRAQPPAAHPDIERRLETLLDDLGAAHRKPFMRE